jgi:menaquinone-specific isochorismate synthase
MENLFRNPESLFKDFLNENKKWFQDSKSTGQLLLQFIIELNDVDHSSVLDNEFINRERAIYLSKPNMDFHFIGFDECFSIQENSDNRFLKIEQHIEKIRNSFRTNLPAPDNVPLFFASIKFLTDDSDEWKDFDDSRWFIPESALFKTGNKNYFIFNLILEENSSLDKFVEKYSKRVSAIFNNSKKGLSISSPNVKDISNDYPKEKKRWKNLVSEAVSKIGEKNLEKVVLSRRIVKKINGELPVARLVQNMASSYPGCFNFIYKRGKSFFIGASPEKLITFSGNEYEIDSLAGSAPRGISDELDKEIEKQLLKTEKNIREQKIVTNFIIGAIKNFSNNYSEKNSLSVKKLRNIQHLYSAISGRLKEGSSVYSMIKELYPTPAICGAPRQQALSFIKKSETYPRGLYSGLIGWVNLKDQGELFIAIRSILINANKLYAFAGSGILDSSDPEDEYKETEIKINSILNFFTNENKPEHNLG